MCLISRLFISYLSFEIRKHSVDSTLNSWGLLHHLFVFTGIVPVNFQFRCQNIWLFCNRSQYKERFIQDMRLECTEPKHLSTNGKCPEITMHRTRNSAGLLKSDSAGDESVCCGSSGWHLGNRCSVRQAVFRDAVGQFDVGKDETANSETVIRLSEWCDVNCRHLHRNHINDPCHKTAKK